jgi:hypothetical protein
MLIYPDSSDLINLCRGTARISISELAQRLAAHSHRLVLSLDTLIELAAPLRNGYLLEVRKQLNQLEQFPVTFANEARIYNMEIREALAAFEQAREYNFTAITPFAPRLSDAIDIHGAMEHRIQGEAVGACRRLRSNAPSRRRPTRYLVMRPRSQTPRSRTVLPSTNFHHCSHSRQHG